MATPVDSCAGCSEGPHIVQSLYDGLRKGTTGSFKETCYIPNDVFNNLFTREKISRAITAIFPELQNPEREKLIDQIDPPSKIEQHETRKKLFAILIKMQIPRAIISFVKDGVSDRHLPFRTGPGDKWLEYRRDHASNQYYPITSFRNDPIDVCELFVLYQWRFLAPFFHFTKTEAPHYSIQPRDIPLPFAEEDPSIRKNGGFGQVCKVKIHQAHHDLGSEYPYFAVKRLFAGVEDAFHQEVKALEVFRNLNHPHLIKLLGTYHYDGEYYLIFPWADGDLRAFWSRNPGPHSIPTASRWVLKQCLGIAEGLRTIHCGQRLYGGSIPVKGRHGDIKPENILHFAHSQGCDGQQWGVLTISDFGLARLHREHSERRVYPHRPPGSLTYRAPEGDFNEPVSTLSDLWPLGCLFLEFVVWLLQGWNEVDNFSKERLKEDNSSHRLLALEDKFFNRGEEFGAYTKPSVLKRVQVLHDHPECTDLIHDLLDLISDKMIRVRTTKRPHCGEIVTDIQDMETRCKRDHSYYTDHKKNVIKRSTHESDKPIPNRIDVAIAASEVYQTQNQVKPSLYESLDRPDCGAVGTSDKQDHREASLKPRANQQFLGAGSVWNIFSILTCCYRRSSRKSISSSE